jgi:hypothetical protein
MTGVSLNPSGSSFIDFASSIAANFLVKRRQQPTPPIPLISGASLHPPTQWDICALPQDRLGACHGKEDAQLRRNAELLRSRASVANPSLPRPVLCAETASCMGMSSSTRSSAATTSAPAAQPVGFKRCCLKTGRYDGSRRNHFFQAEAMSEVGSVRSRSPPQPTRKSPLISAAQQVSAFQNP